MKTRQSTPDTSCDRTVAKDAPKTPQWKVTMNSRSSPMFRQADSMRKATGVTESPRERRWLDKILYNSVAGIPAKITTI